MPVLQSPMENQSGEYYRSIGKLPLSRFIDVVVDNNIYALVITGHPTIEQLHDAWNDINSQYADAIGDAEYKLYLSAFKDVTVLTLTLQAIEACIDTLKLFPHAYLFDELNRLLSTSFNFDFKDYDEYQKLLKRCWQRSRSFKIQLDLKLISFEAIRKKFEDSKPPTREYFQSILITLSDHAKYPIMETITVFEFAERLHRLNKYHEQLKLAK